MWTEGLFVVRFLVKSHNLKLFVRRLLGRPKREGFCFFLKCHIVNVCDKFLNFKQPILMHFRMAASALSFVYLRLLLRWWFFLFKKFLESVAFLHLLLHKNFSFLLFECPLKLLRKYIKSSLNILLLCLYFSPYGHCSVSESMTEKQ